MEHITKYVLLRLLLSNPESKVHVSDVEDVVLSDIPSKCNLILVSNPGDFQRELDISIRQLNLFTSKKCGVSCVTLGDGWVELHDNKCCRETLSELLREYKRYNSMDAVTILSLKLVEKCIEF